MAKRQNYNRAGQSGYGRDSYSYRGNGRGRYDRTTYVEGNTARQLAAEPERREEQRPERQVRRAPRREPVHMPGIHFVSLLFLFLVIAVALYICISYVRAQNQVQEEKGTIIKMQSEIAQMKESNDADYQNVLDSVDLAEVYRKATEELGMVHAKSNQIYTYENKKSDMVKQYGEIPSAVR